ncbi:MAG: filamentous hemagglutinin family protein, partial [Sandaracinobacteroides sp.]
GSVVRTSSQPARRNTKSPGLYNVGFGRFAGGLASPFRRIPIGLEGILTLRGGDIFGFTDGNIVLNQSRLFAQNANNVLPAGNIALWSSNGDLNAGQGPKSAFNFPPVVYNIDPNGAITVDAVGGVTGAGIAAFAPNPDAEVVVFLIAPRGEVDAGDAGVRVQGNLFVAAQSVANADNFDVSGDAIGVPTTAVVDAGAQSAASNAGTAAGEAATAGRNTLAEQLSRIVVTVDGYVRSLDPCEGDPATRPASCPTSEAAGGF